MRKLFISVLFLLTTTVAVRAQQTVFVPACQGDATLDTAKLTAIKSTVGSTNQATIKLPYKLTPSQRCKFNTATLTANLTIDNTDGSGLSVVTGQTLTIAGPIVAPPKQLFFNATAGLGTVSLSGNTSLQKLSPQWWGVAGADATIDTPALQATQVASGGYIPVYFTAGLKPRLNATINSGGPITWISDGVVGEDSGGNLPTIRWYGAANGTMLSCTGYNYILIRGLGFNMKGSSNAANSAIVVDGPTVESKMILDNLLITLDGINANAKGLSFSPTASTNNENIRISSTVIAISNSGTIGVSRGTAIDLGGNSNEIVVTMDHVWLRQASVGLKVLGGQQISFDNGFFTSNDIDAQTGVDITLSNSSFEASRQNIKTSGGDVTLAHNRFTGDAWVAGTPPFDFAASSARHTLIDNGFVLSGGIAPTLLFTAGVGSADSVFAIGNAYTSVVGNYATAGFGGGYVSCFDVGASPVSQGKCITQAGSGQSADFSFPAFNQNSDSYLRVQNLGDTYWNRLGADGLWSNARLNVNIVSKDDAAKSGWQISPIVSTTDAASAWSLRYYPVGSTTPSVFFSLSGAGNPTFLNTAAPGTPAAGYVTTYIDSADKTFKAKDDAGVIKTLVKPDAGASNNFLTAISTAGVPSKAQPSSSNLSDAANIPLLNTANTFSNAVKSSGTAGIGYATGAGGTVAQATSKATGVTLNKITGTITTFNDALAAGAEVSFVVTNSTCAATDVPVVAIKSGGTLGAYAVVVSAVGAGSFTVTITNLSAGSLSEAIAIQFAIIKGVAS